jgi:hypothetical protein
MLVIFRKTGVSDIILFHSSIPIARIGEPEAPTSFSGVIKSVNF